jgi:hypothetical protein
MFQPNWPSSGAYSGKDIAAHCNAVFLSIVSALGYFGCTWFLVLFGLLCGCLACSCWGMNYTFCCSAIIAHRQQKAMMAKQKT